MRLSNPRHIFFDRYRTQQNPYFNPATVSPLIAGSCCPASRS